MEAAELGFLEALRLAPGEVRIHNNYASFLRDRQEYERAAAEYRKILEIDDETIGELAAAGALT